MGITPTSTGCSFRTMNLPEHWYRRSLWLWLLAPLALLFCLLVWLRRQLYRRGWLASEAVDVPVIVVGNISVGGTGKTPLVLWLADFLRRQGYRPGLISRGYGGQSEQWPLALDSDADPKVVGDEALLLARRSGCPMVVGPDRVAAARLLRERHDVDVILSDDGLQHYRLQRQIEIAVLDGARRLGNRLCLPAGPLREPPSRLRSVDLVVVNGEPSACGEWAMSLRPVALNSLVGEPTRALATLSGLRVHGVAGIGHPQRFFATLRQAGCEVVEHPYTDHHPYRAGELDFGDDLPVLMTEKDAVKYTSYADRRHWYLPVVAELPDAFGQAVLAKLESNNG